ncbi:MAG: LytTR family DNA-binding domain-containing protein [Lachnospira sp.]|nr:LytTR family DNA-binding domain-containing protein [Lachnospira sp.]
MLNIALVENDSDDAKTFCEIAGEFFSQNNEQYKINVYTSAEVFLHNYSHQYQMIFMDIELDGMNGMDAAHKLREIDTDVLLIFLTNLAHYAIAGYEVNAADYILKPLSANAFSLKMPKVMAIIKQQSKKTITVLSKGEMHTFTTDELYFVEILSHRLYYHTVSGVYDSRGTISDAEEDLYPYHFRRCNNSYLVNLKFVSSIEGNDVKVGPNVLPISRPKKKIFINELTNYLGGQL